MEETKNPQNLAAASDAGDVGGGGDTSGYDALQTGAALVDHAGRRLLRLSGKDPVGMLNAVLTNEVPKETGLGAYALLLSPKGRIQTDLRVLKCGEDILVVTEPEGADAAREILGRYAPFSRVKLEDLSQGDAPWSALGLYGPAAPRLLAGLRLAEHESAQIEVGGAMLLAAGVTVPVPGFDLLGPADALLAAREHLLRNGAVAAKRDAYETARVGAGVPRFGADMTPENFPAEAGVLGRAVNFTKGCYPGQETVARMHYRGHPNRTLRRFVVGGPPPAPGAGILQAGKQVGMVTTVAPLPVDGHTFALGYLHRKADPDAPLDAGEAKLGLLDRG
jgi:tRNA-modifying protein YgfZ